MPITDQKTVGILLIALIMIPIIVIFPLFYQTLTPISTDLNGSHTAPIIVIGADKLHAQGIYGNGTRIGIVDSGIYENHTELQGKIVAKRSFVLTSNGYSDDIITTEDIDGHGTWVGGIVAGKTAGIAPAGQLVVAKVFHGSTAGNAGRTGEETTQAVIEAIKFCLNNSVDVINLSFGQYYNLPIEAKQTIINYAVSQGVVVVASAGNQGMGATTSGIIGNPGTALQDICVAAYDGGTGITSFTSTGPRSDWTLKPDIAAPGISVPGPGITNPTAFVVKSGTSAAAPLVSGAAALLISAARQIGMNVTPSLIKAALMKGATNLNLPAYRQGAGLLNVSKSWELLQIATRVNNIPNIFYVHPQRVPFEPIQTLFCGQSLAFNISVITPFFSNFSVIMDNQLSFIKMNNFTANLTTIVPLLIIIPSSLPQGQYSGKITINNTQHIAIDIAIRAPKGKILFDEYHNLFCHRNTLAYDAFGESTFLYGEYRQFWNLMTEAGYLIQPNHYQLTNYTFMLDFDLVILANPASYLYDEMTDWIDPNTLSPSSIEFSNEELLNLRNYVQTAGKSLLVLSQSPETTNYTILNNFTQAFGITFLENYTSSYPGSAAITPKFFFGSQYRHYGTALSITADVDIIALHNGQVVAAKREFASQGIFMVFTSDYWIINSGLITDSLNVENNAFLLIIIQYLLKHPIQISSLTGSLYGQRTPIGIESLIVVFSLLVSITHYSKHKRVKIAMN